MSKTVGSLLLISILAFNASGAVMAVGPGAFPAGSTLIDFATGTDGAEVNGLVVDGVTFSYLIGGNPTNGSVALDGGPGTTNNVDPLNIVSIGDPSGILRMTLASSATMLGYGYAILNLDPVVGATTISLFDGDTFVGSLSYDATPDPSFAGGFAGIQSDVSFNRVDVTFNPFAAPAFAVDNILIASDVPEPASGLLVLAGCLAAFAVRRRL